MKIDVGGRVRNTALPSSKPLLPLYEAIVNSIQSIEETGCTDGAIDIIVKRDGHSFDFGDVELRSVVGFEVIDNGAGFDDRNYAAFETADTTNKAQKGGKGNGRFMWLVAFERVDIDSHYDIDGKLLRRTFTFAPTPDGVLEAFVGEPTSDRRLTSVRLDGYREKYQQQCPKKLDTIAAHIVEHCLEYFVRPDCPQITLSDNHSGEHVDLNARFELEIAEKSSPTSITVAGQAFEVLHLRLYTSHVQDHLMHYCAHNRVVRSDRLSGKIPNLSRRLQDDAGRDFTYAAYVEGAALDGSVNSERTDFDIVDDEGVFDEPITWSALRKGLYECSSEYLKPYTETIREKRRQRIEDFVSREGPMYRSIMKYIAPKLETLDPDIGDDELDIDLYRAYHDLQVDVRKEGDLLMRDQRGGFVDWVQFQEKVQAYFEKLSDINSSNLARYVCHRRAVLDFLSCQLGRGEAGRYNLEANIHQIIFPMRKTSDEINFGDHNLWILDERMAFHDFLASDKPIRSLPQIQSESDKEPDLVIFDKALALTSGEPPYSAITIVEFKRPMRNSYDSTENPFRQVCKYIDDIRAGKARTEQGRDIPVVGHIPITCYFVCDITGKLKEEARVYGLQATPDGQGYYGYLREWDAYFEVMSFSKVLTDAKKRNQAFFAQLGLPIRTRA